MGAPPPPAPTLYPVSRLYLRALRLRCPACGGRPVFVTWFRMCPNCPVCGLHFDREPGGYWLGSYTVNLMVTEAVFAAVLVGALIATWPTPPWQLVQYLSIGVMVAFPFLFFPFSKTLYIAIDLTFRPDEAEDFDAPREAEFKPQRRP